VDFEHLRINVLDSKRRTRSPVPCDAETLRWIRRLIASRTSGPLFLSQKTGEGLTVDGVRLAVRRAAYRAGLEAGRHVTPRTCRHTFARTWDDMHGSIRGLQEILRHRNLSSTQHYLDHSLDEAHREYQRLMAQRGPSPLVSAQGPREPGYIA